MYATKWAKKLRNLQLLRNYSVINKIRDYKKYYRILGIPEDSDQEQIRKAYLDLVKKYHPDSGTEFADAAQFQKIDEAFKILLRKKSQDRWISVQEYAIEEQDIEHTAPQHRQYLSYDGVGTGSPAQREKEYAKVKAIRAADNVLEHRMSRAVAAEKTLMDKSSARYKHKIKTKYGYERLVEDLIQESMSRGEFSNLSGTGKPLPQHQNTNPYVDFVTHKLNQILIDNGFTPEWITLRKEIVDETQLIRDSLTVERKRFGKCPLNDDDRMEWDTAVSSYKRLAEDVNKKIAKYNLLVPLINRQMIAFSLTKEADKVLERGPFGNDGEIKERKTVSQKVVDGGDNFLSNLIESIFRK